MQDSVEVPEQNDAENNEQQGVKIYYKSHMAGVLSETSDHSRGSKLTNKYLRDMIQRELTVLKSSNKETLARTKQLEEELIAVSENIVTAERDKLQAIDLVGKTETAMSMLKEDAEKFIAKTKEPSKRIEELSIKMKRLIPYMEKMQKLTERIEDLQMKIKLEQNLPEPVFIDRHIQENASIKEKILEKMNKLNVKKERINEIEHLKNENFKLKKSYYEIQQKKITTKDELEIENQARDMMTSELNQKYSCLLEHANKLTNEQNNLQDKLEKMCEETEKTEIATAELLKSNEEIQFILEPLKSQINNKKSTCEDEINAKRNLLSTEQDRLKAIDVENENYQAKYLESVRINSEKYNQLVLIKESKYNLLNDQLQIKSELAMIESRVAEKKRSYEQLVQDVNDLTKQIIVEQGLKNDQIVIKCDDLQIELQQVALEHETNVNRLKDEFKEKFNQTEKEQNLEKAKLEIQFVDITTKLEDMRKRKRDLEQRVNHSSERIPLKDMTNASKDSRSKNKYNLKETETSVNEEIESEGEESGRKSPGILKSPHTKQQSTSRQKKVTFRGISSADSESDEDPLDALLPILPKQIKKIRDF